MPTLLRLLVDYEDDLLEVIASFWDVDLRPDSHRERAELLADTMLNRDIFNLLWERLSQEEKQALDVLQAQQGQLPVVHFERTFGELRPMGPARRQRERPWLNPDSITEKLFYRGLIGRVFVRGQGGAQSVIAIPDDLQLLLPQQGSSNIDTGQPGTQPSSIPDGVCTSPDDIATVLAWQMMQRSINEDWLDPMLSFELDVYLRKLHKPSYRSLLITLALESGLLKAGDPFGVNRERARPWLEAPRAHQIRALAEAWRDTIIWNDLAYTPGLQADAWPNDILAGRNTLLNALSNIPSNTWWDTHSFIEHIKQTTPDFQRPGSDYTAWYIHDEHTGTILHGFQYWDVIEGNLLRFMLEGPMMWLGLTQAHDSVFRITPFGEALIGQGTWPSDADPATELQVSADGSILIDAAMSRYHRLQIARFAAWTHTPPTPAYIPGQPVYAEQTYAYQITSSSLKRATRQNIGASHIVAFLQSNTSVDLPSSLIEGLERWQANPNAVALRDLVIVTAHSRNMYEVLRKHPTIRPLIEQRAGETGFAVERRNLEALRKALWDMGIIPDFDDNNG